MMSKNDNSNELGTLTIGMVNMIGNDHLQIPKNS